MNSFTTVETGLLIIFIHDSFLHYIVLGFEEKVSVLGYLVVNNIYGTSIIFRVCHKV